MDWQKKYRWQRISGKETGLGGKLHEDFIGWDGETNIGRIYLDQQTLKAGKWRWAIQYPKGESLPAQHRLGDDSGGSG
ncbi:hypothetical protein E2F50_01020 [Rhizobium deserti]|uniref:Uncharacterized protein n=1 Tax=Rhizobium deserti TaxID=2547961 RepID=A0A4R5ULQ4_9HYPH|nr:hypothetical protein [Rhizobium deserti]TDK38765.1 hypothetical protein E2F50_01020 [Rhizobium deserti]